MRTSHLLLVVTVSLLASMALGANLVLQGTLRDQAPDTMIHANYPENYWKYDGWTNNPKDGTCGNANSGKGWPNSDFELPLYQYATVRIPNGNGKQTNGEYGLVGDCCNASNSWTNCGRLGTDRTPVYRYSGASPLNTVKGPSSFYHWFHDTDYTFEKTHSITLTPKTAGGRLYTYSNSYFFPLDNDGWKDSNRGDKINNQDVWHNYAYCYEIHGRFSYQGGEVFEFEGDDDVWVYLDNRLVIDLGGIHTVQTAAVKVDQMGLTKGTNYRFDFFYCERHTTNSKLQITTSIEIACTYYDWCDICEGDGQSCCTAKHIAETCNDNNACTEDKCAIIKPPEVDCQHVPITCDDKSECTIDSCDTKAGCIFKKRSCEDFDACTLDSCNNSTGCVFAKITCPGDKCNIPSCDTKTGCKTTPVDCNDNNDCTKDTCVADRGCVYSTINCDDGDACTADTCEKVGGCKNLPVNCNDTNACTIDTCSSTSGCQKVPLSCDDKNACTDDSCDTKTGCVNKPKVCDDKNACTIDSCDIKLGCQFVAKDCDDKNACTTDSCDVLTGCKNTTISCDDMDKCTVDSCDPKSGCLRTPLNCDDKNACTKDSCDSVKGCSNLPISCDDKNECTLDSCDAKTGCVNLPRVCNDNNLCTTDTCEKASGCIFSNVTCDDQDKCTTDSCDPKSGCGHSTVNCDDGSPCTTDSCNKNTGCVNVLENCGLCQNAVTGIPKTCAPRNGNLCDPVECDLTTGDCTIVRSKVCDDNSLCTTDACVSTTGNCTFTPVNCDDNNKCTTDRCDAATGCSNTPVNCDDNNPCTEDTCSVSTGNCTHTLKPGFCLVCVGAPAPCTWTNPCEPVECVNNACVAQKKDCDDQNLCTKDSCIVSANNTAVCESEPIVCDNSNPCAPQTCNVTDGVCVAKVKQCDDQNACTEDKCDSTSANADCLFTPLPCAAKDACHPRSCNTTTGQCLEFPVVCNDSNYCTDDTCETVNGEAKCIFTPRDCNNTDLCNPQSCDPTNGNCLITPVGCDDGNLCTEDKCVVANGAPTCNHTLISCDSYNTGNWCKPAVCDSKLGCVPGDWICDDNNPCTLDECVGTMNCTHTLGLTCDDGDACTENLCDSNARTLEEACSFVNLTCVAPTVCQVVRDCDHVNGCRYDPMVCPEPDDWCKQAVCDETAGCVPFPKPCLVDDADCFEGVCDSAARQCVTNRRPDWATTKSEKGGGVTCFVLYEQAKTGAIIAGGIIAAIVVAAVVFAALAAFAARKAYLFMQLRQGNMGAAQCNPLYSPGTTSGENPLFNT